MKITEKNKLLLINSITCMFLGGFVLLMGITETVNDFKTTSRKTIIETKSYNYARGVNDGLNAIMLLALELGLKKEHKTWGEMRDIVCTRLLDTNPNASTNDYDAIATE